MYAAEQSVAGITRALMCEAPLPFFVTRVPVRVDGTAFETDQWLPGAGSVGDGFCQVTGDAFMRGLNDESIDIPPAVINNAPDAKPTEKGDGGVDGSPVSVTSIDSDIRI